MKKFLKENKGLSTLAFIALITIIVYILSVYYPHKFPNTDIWLELLFQLSIGYIINFIFYILQVYLYACFSFKETSSFSHNSLEYAS